MVHMTSHGGAIVAICVASGVLLYLAEGRQSSAHGDENAPPCPHGAARCAEIGYEAAAAACPYMASRRAASAIVGNQWFLGAAVAVAAVAAGTFFFAKNRQQGLLK